MTQEVSACQHCGKPLPLRVETRGRKARFCSHACRAAAYRVRKQHQIETELIQARTQLSIDLRADSEPEPGDLAHWIDVFANTLEDTSNLTADEVAVIEAAGRLTERVRPSDDAGNNVDEPDALSARLTCLEARVAGIETRLEGS